MGRSPFLVQLDNENDEALVRSRLASPRGYQESYKPLVREWLKEQDAKRAASILERSEARDSASLAIAQDANDIARSALANSRSANIIAIIAMALSMATAIAVAAIQFKWLP